MKTPRHFVPTLQELRALETVVRQGSISAAAIELNVSQPTITYHIKQLESRWGAKLFQKKGRKLEPTELVRDTFSQVAAINMNIDSLSSFLSQKTRQKPFSIGVAPSFCSIILISRLEEFAELHPEIDVRVSATNRYVDFAKENVDVALRLLPRQEITSAITTPNLLIPVPNEQMKVVCAPGYIQQLTNLPLSPGNMDINLLTTANLIHEDDTFHWQKYFSAHLPEFDEPIPRKLTINNADLILNRTLRGQDMAILRELYVNDAIRDGLLVEPFKHRLPCERVFQFALPEHKMPTNHAWDFITWLGSKMLEVAD